MPRATHATVRVQEPPTEPEPMPAATFHSPTHRRIYSVCSPRHDAGAGCQQLAPPTTAPGSFRRRSQLKQDLRAQPSPNTMRQGSPEVTPTTMSESAPSSPVAKTEPKAGLATSPSASKGTGTGSGNESPAGEAQAKGQGEPGDGHATATATGSVDGAAASTGTEQNVISFNSAINACAQRGQVEQAVKLLQTMRAQGVDPDIMTYNSVIHACVSPSHIRNQNGRSTTEFEMCFFCYQISTPYVPGVPAPYVPGVPTKTRLESSIKRFKPHFNSDWGLGAGRAGGGGGHVAGHHEGQGHRARHHVVSHRH